MEKRKINEINLLKESYGSEITLYDENNNEHVFDLLLELEYNGKQYAYFQSKEADQAAEEGDIEVLEIVKNDDGELGLDYIEDDEEWDTAAELFDEWTDSFD